MARYINQAMLVLGQYKRKVASEHESTQGMRNSNMASCGIHTILLVISLSLAMLSGKSEN